MKSIIDFVVVTEYRGHMRGMICMTSAIRLVSPFWSTGGKGQDKSFFPKACKIVLRVEHVFLVVVDPMGNHVG
jgi:hypothetical protein